MLSFPIFPMTFLHSQIKWSGIKPTFRFILRFSVLALSLKHISCSCCVLREMSKIFQGYQNRSCGWVVFTTPAELKKGNIWQFCLPDHNHHNFQFRCLILCLPVCLIKWECVCLCLRYVCPTRVSLLPCVFCNMRKSVSELGDTTQKETGSPERGDNRMPSLTPTDMDTWGHLGESHATLHLGECWHHWPFQIKEKNILEGERAFKKAG